MSRTRCGVGGITGKPSVIYYLVRLRKSMTRDEFLTAVHNEAGGLITSAVMTGILSRLYHTTAAAATPRTC